MRVLVSTWGASSSDLPVGPFEVPPRNHERELAVAGQPVQLDAVAQRPHRDARRVAGRETQRRDRDRELDDRAAAAAAQRSALLVADRLVGVRRAPPRAQLLLAAFLPAP